MILRMMETFKKQYCVECLFQLPDGCKITLQAGERNVFHAGSGLDQLDEILLYVDGCDLIAHFGEDQSCIAPAGSKFQNLCALGQIHHFDDKADGEQLIANSGRRAVTKRKGVDGMISDIKI